MENKIEEFSVRWLHSTEWVCCVLFDMHTTDYPSIGAGLVSEVCRGTSSTFHNNDRECPFGV